MEKRQDIQQVLQSEDLTPIEKEKLQLVVEIRQFSMQELGLDESDNYTQYVRLDRDWVAYNLVVCRKDSLAPETWWFPFSGRVGYLGFFNRHYAKETKKDYDDEDYDTYLRGVSAYSTLGWFSDPVLSTMLTYRPDSLANLIIHELSHSTIYKKGDTAFNEGVATFIGNVGSILFLTKKYGAQSKEHQRALDARYDDRLFSQFIDKARGRLKKYYSRKMSYAAKVKGRVKEFEQIKSSFREVKHKFRTNAYSHFARINLNNAVVSAFGQYYQDLEIFETVWQYHRKDFKKTLSAFKEAGLAASPIKELRRRFGAQ